MAHNSNQSGHPQPFPNPKGRDGMKLRNSGARTNTSARRTRGYTLIEVMIAIIMFAAISVALSFVISTALIADHNSRRRVSMTQETRAVSEVLQRDLSQAIAVTGNPNTMFVTGGAGQGTLLTFTSLLGPDPSAIQDSMTGNSTPTGIIASDMVTIAYAFDESTHTLSRMVSTTPGVDYLPQPGQPNTILSNRIANVSLEFYDAANQQLRQDWDYENPVPTAGASGTGGAAVAPATSTTDTSLPSSVHVTLDFFDSDGGQPRSESLVIPLKMSTPLAKGQAPPAPAAGPAPGGSRSAAVLGSSLPRLGTMGSPK